VVVVVVSSKVLTTWAAAVRKLYGLSSLHQRGKEHYWQCPMQGRLAVSTGLVNVSTRSSVEGGIVRP